MKTLIKVSLATFMSAISLGLAQEWEPAGDRMKSPWATQVDPERPWPEYPRPQMVRQNWGNMNGLWDYAIRDAGDEIPEDWDGKILVPFPVESSLSGVAKAVEAGQQLWYRAPVFVPDAWRTSRLLLHFGAVDWHSKIWLNGKQVGEHKGGFTPFTLDISEHLKEGEEQDLVVSVLDPTNDSFQPRGKQVREPEGIFYTAVTGIWQTVWIEPVPQESIESYKLVPDIDGNQLKITVNGRGVKGDYEVLVQALDGQTEKAEVSGKLGEEITLPVEDAKLWTPENPFLYNLRVYLMDGEEVVDGVTGYFGMRKISIAKDDSGYNRLMLNNEPVFQFGPLDQGWWPDGLYTPPTDRAMGHDILMTKRLGFNMARKHVKVEMARWYYHCDRLGLLVWQDFPSGDKSISPTEPDIERSKESEENFRREYKEMIDFLHNHPSIVVWVPFNEGWGQFKTTEILEWTKEYDPSRLVDGPSGWADRGTGDMNDMHRYPGPAMPEPEDGRAVVLGEFGGLGLPVEEHLWWDKRNWGYRTYQTKEELWMNYERLIRKLLPLIGQGLAAAVYTQTTDVEGEVNGLMTYDRAVLKFDQDQMRELNVRVYEPQPDYERVVVLPSSREEAQTWKYTTEDPGEGWFQPEFEVNGWKEGPGGFGTEETPGTVVRTGWDTSDIWLRRTFEMGEGDVGLLSFTIHHDEDVEIYINGEKTESFSGYESGYVDIEASQATRNALKAGSNVIAVHCRQTDGGQYIDLGLVTLKEKPANADSDGTTEQ